MASASGLTFKLHPLVILNISDHFIRVRAQNNGGPKRVIGCVLGSQSGRTVEIFNSFELNYKLESGSVVIDREFLDKKMEQYKKVFPSYDILGWYSTGSDVHELDMQVHRGLMDINESPVYVLLDPTVSPTVKDLPITLYESELHIIDNVHSNIFVSCNYTIETVEAERISVDYVAHIKPSDGSSAATQLAAHLTGMHSAIKMLSSRIRELYNILRAMEKGEEPLQASLLRQVASLVKCLPAIESTKFREDFQTEYNDTLLMAYMATITKGNSTINELVEKFNTATERGGRRAALRPFG
eukprot:TRINITY_DN39181_c0_g1_i1.p1 TRINITY_DN39181_c0_g1~~TRINITY_DN39181_c0_g1_i1.p1  ORF type:complete len:299 (-),score=46.63 TRINITY_DN39181_c0_g1_i1:655-1551(-)